MSRLKRRLQATPTSPISSPSCAALDAAMALYFLNLKTFGRSGGSSAVSAAAYRAGERIRDERTGRIYDHTDRQGILHKEIVLPSQFDDVEASWAKDRAGLWNT